MTSARRLPNPRVQRTRAYASLRRSPLTRHPLGHPKLPAVVIAVTLMSCVSSNANSSPPVASAEEVRIITATVADKQFWQAWGMNEHPILLDQTAASGSGPLADRDFVSFDPFKNLQVDQGLINSLNAAENGKASLKGVAVPAPLVLVEQFEFDRALSSHQEDPWAFFIQRFPGVSRIVTVSRPALSEDHAYALVAVTYFAVAPCCSAGYTAYLTKGSGSWSVAAYGGFWTE